ncbi:MAG: monovalent cation/H+ antiporter subunit D family protein [Clostridiaceae bacterium]|jgi:formate hydrogenlyase subunit 3/multisubunit Na+/H+ antiporter MnhD subunit|nr:monovalent cation/H+ antiporter subunit D family protein [Clostridiaceae bacterium]
MPYSADALKIYLVLGLSSGAAGGLAVMLIPGARRRLRNMITLLFAASGAVFSWLTALSVFAGKGTRIGFVSGDLEWSLDPDPLGAVFGLIASTLWMFATVYSFGYMAEKSGQRVYYSFFLFSLSAAVGVAFAGNLVTLYLFYELLTLATYPLVIHERTPEAAAAGTKYIMYNLSGAGAILIAIIITYRYAGDPGFTGGPVLAGVNSPMLGWLLVMYIVGFGVKAALMPLHRWLPAAMVAPTPVSALLHAVAVVYAGVFGVIRVVYSVFGRGLAGQLGISRVLPWVAASTILAGVIVALRQDVLKRRLAYQTVSHLSYILLGAFTLQPWGLAGAMMQMITYPFMKMTLFFCAGIIARQTGETRISRMGGVGRKLPWTMAAFTAAALGMTGMLPLSTFWGKYYLMKGSVAGGMWPFALVLAASGLINAACFIPVVVQAFRGDKTPSCKEKGGSMALMFAPAAALVVIALVTGLVPGIVWPGAEAVTDWFFG